MRSGFCDACEGQALALRLRRRADRATVVRGPVPRRAFSVSEAGCAGCAGWAARAFGPKVWKTFMSIDISRNYDAKVREDLMCSAAGPIGPECL